MIKVNLTKTRVTGNGEFNEAMVSPSETIGVGPLTILFKILLMLFATVGLMTYERININSLQSQLSTLNLQSVQLNQEYAKLQQQTAPMKEFEGKAKELEDKLKIMKKLSRLRLRAVKALDFIQTSLPERMWFTSIDMKEEKVILKGYSATDEDISKFLKTIEGSVLFTNVLLVRAEVSRLPNGEGKQFEIDCESEVAK
jgi:type IV pilus assembly protein PilN